MCRAKSFIRKISISVNSLTTAKCLHGVQRALLRNSWSTISRIAVKGGGTSCVPFDRCASDHVRRASIKISESSRFPVKVQKVNCSCDYVICVKRHFRTAIRAAKHRMRKSSTDIRMTLALDDVHRHSSKHIVRFNFERCETGYTVVLRLHVRPFPPTVSYVH